MKRNPDYVPIANTTLTGFRVPMWRDDDAYEVCIADHKYRMYDDETLPDFIKASLSMIHAFPYKESNLPVFGWYWTNTYINNQDSRLNDIGWRVNDNLYILVMTPEQLESLNV